MLATSEAPNFLRQTLSLQGTTDWAAVDFKIDGWEAVTP